MPTDLSFRLGARKAIFAHLEAERGAGWWGAPGMESYYGDHARGENPFNWVRVHPLFDTGAGGYPFDHAGVGETALMQALAPETVDMDRLGDGGHWYVAGAGAATPTLGEQGAALAEARARGLMGL